MANVDIPKNMNHTFYCCLRDALQHEVFDDVHHLHNLTYKCNEHTHYGHFEAYVKKVIKIMFSEPNTINCTSYNSTETVTYTTSYIQSGLPDCRTKTQGWYNLYVIVWVVGLIIGLVGNSLVCMAFLKSKKLRKNVENYFVTSLAISDLLVILFIIPIKIEHALHNHLFCAPVPICRLYMMTDHLFFMASILNILVLTITRYITIIKPYDFRKILTPFRAKTVIVLIWTVAISGSVMTNVDAEHGNFDGIVIEHFRCTFRHKDQLSTLLQYAFIFFLPCVIMLVIYVHIYYISMSHSQHIKQDSRRMQVPSSNYQRRNSLNKISIIIQQSASFINRKLESRATKVLVLLYGSFVICWLPLIILVYLQANEKIKNIPTAVYAIFAEVLPVLHSILDPFIYGVVHKDFKTTLKKILGVSFLQYQRRGSGGNCRKTPLTLSINTARSNLEVPAHQNETNRRSSSSSYRECSPTSLGLESNLLRTEDGYPIYRVPSTPTPTDFSINDNFFPCPGIGESVKLEVNQVDDEEDHEAGEEKYQFCQEEDKKDSEDDQSSPTEDSKMLETN